jgi:NADPH-dependent 7-cyano-7-deazaguanine reductase QueF
MSASMDCAAETGGFICRMITIHEFTAKCNCPVDGGPDNYEVIIETRTDIPVETILSATEALKNEQIFQEEFTRRLARSLGVTVTTIGYHSGIRTTCKAP